MYSKEKQGKEWLYCWEDAPGFITTRTTNRLRTKKELNHAELFRWRSMLIDEVLANIMEDVKEFDHPLALFNSGYVILDGSVRHSKEEIEAIALAIINKIPPHLSVDLVKITNGQKEGDPGYYMFYGLAVKDDTLGNIEKGLIKELGYFAFMGNQGKVFVSKKIS